MSQSLTALYLQNPQLANALRRQSRGAQMLQQGGDSSPVDHPLQGFARLAQALVGGYEQGQADKEIKGADEARKARIASILRDGEASPPQMQAPAMPTQPVAPRQPVGQQFLPPAGVDPEEDYLVRTVFGEARGEPAQGQQAVAHVIRNRARAANMPIRDVVLAPGQFEPWGNPQTRAQLEGLDPASPEYQAILTNVRGGTQDPTGGATHFYSPTAQAAAGRPTPAWAQGQGQDIGRHRFYNLPYSAPRGAAPAGDTIPAQMPAQAPGAPPAPRTPDAAAHYMAEAQRLERQAMALEEEGAHGQASLRMQMAQGARQMAMARAPQPAEFDQLLRAAGLEPGTPGYQQAARSLIDAKARGQSTNVTTVGGATYGQAPPAGWQYRTAQQPDGSTVMRLEEIPGGPAEQARIDKERKQGERDAGAVRSGGIVTQDIDRALTLLDGANLPTTGLGAGWLSSIPGTGASDMKSLLEGVGANIAFDKLQQMRESSPTGAALGAVSDTENRMLQSVYGSLSQSQSPQQFRENLGRLKTIYMDIIHGKGKWQEVAPSETTPMSGPAAPAVDGGGWSIKPKQ